MPREMRSYAAHLQKTMEWFGTGLLETKTDALAEPARDAATAGKDVHKPTLAQISLLQRLRCE
ncbi:hypothetical protein LMG24238_05605 [Paraburkholderia sediminicola]|uniref:Uncharacterized protein n=1 Tax=Paraburkholderia sediminicola TaxID=458836 RepID=A0A6J5C8Z1_9BURK|nr:hypothetical protein LMG24238_05605 [Paraburkholderia sediminicola]